MKLAVSIVLMSSLCVLAFCSFAPSQSTNGSSQTQPAKEGAVPAPAGESAAKVAKEQTLDLGGGVTMKLVLVPAGKFMMGSPKDERDRDKNEGPQHEVTIDKPFYMGVYEVTQEQYEQVMGKNPSNFKGANNPVEHVRWYEAMEFCTRVSRKTGKTVRLPREAEWEYACRAGTTTRFGYGDGDDKMGDYAWYVKNSGKKTHVVGKKKPNGSGLYDMHGNVWEWCADWYDEYANAGKVDHGPTSGQDRNRVLRGGGWYNEPRNCRSASRANWHPDILIDVIGFGFRVCVDLK